MRIDLVSEHASPLAAIGDVDAGGQNVHVAALAGELAARGAAVRVHTRRDDPWLPRRVPLPSGVEVVHLDAGPARRIPKDDIWPLVPELADRLVEEWRHDRPDVVHAHFWMSAAAAVLARQRTGVPVAVTFHALGAEKRLHQGAKDTSPPERVAVEAGLSRAADLVIATTRSEADHHLRVGAARSRVAVVPCGVDLGRFRPRGPSPSRHPDPARLRIGVVSRLVERKGIGNVIEALQHVPGAELVVAGGPPPEGLDSDPEALRMGRIARRHGVADRVTLLGAVDRHAVPALLRSVDVVACCPWYEPFGLVALEAMACGRPVVATRVGGLAETVSDGVTGLHVPPRRPAAIAQALRRLEDPDLRRRMGAAAVRRARDYGWDRVARGTEASLARIARSAPVPLETSA